MVFPANEDLQLVMVRAGRKPHNYRCHGCGSLLFRAIFAPESYVEIRCRKCGKMSVFDGKEPEPQTVALVESEQVQ